MAHVTAAPPDMGLRDNLTPHAVAYVALAELTGAILVTGDERIATAAGTRCGIHLIE